MTADILVGRTRKIARLHGFLHWEIAFPNVWAKLTSDEPQGGFDAIIGNPPYVRQELLGELIKRALKKAYKAYDGMADLYIYFPSVPTMMRQSPPGSLPLRAEVKTSDGYAPYQ
jgi:hypothetical protein